MHACYCGVGNWTFSIYCAINNLVTFIVLSRVQVLKRFDLTWPFCLYSLLLSKSSQLWGGLLRRGEELTRVDWKDVKPSMKCFTNPQTLGRKWTSVEVITKQHNVLLISDILNLFAITHSPVGLLAPCTFMTSCRTTHIHLCEINVMFQSVLFTHCIPD